MWGFPLSAGLTIQLIQSYAMPIRINADKKSKLAQVGVTTLHAGDFDLPDHAIFEPPCSLKWMGIHHSIEMDAFSYAVSGFYFGCRIGRYCSIGEHVQIGRHPHPMHWVSTSPFFYNTFENVLNTPPPEGRSVTGGKDFICQSPPVIAKTTTLGHDVWIGHGAFILPGVSIGTGAVIGALSVVTKDVPPYAVVAGSPAAIKRYRFSDEQIQKMLASRWWEYAPWDLKQMPVDNFPAFFDFMDGLRQQALPIYQPEKLNIKSLS